MSRLTWIHTKSFSLLSCICLASCPNPPRRRRRRPSSSVGRVVCPDGTELDGEDNRREVRLYQPPEKRPRTKDDDHQDEKDSEMTLNRYEYFEDRTLTPARFFQTAC
jgi:hypothetical protein